MGAYHEAIEQYKNAARAFLPLTRLGALLELATVPTGPGDALRHQTQSPSSRSFPSTDGDKLKRPLRKLSRLEFEGGDGSGSELKVSLHPQLTTNSSSLPSGAIKCRIYTCTHPPECARTRAPTPPPPPAETWTAAVQGWGLGYVMRESQASYCPNFPVLEVCFCLS